MNVEESDVEPRGSGRYPRHCCTWPPHSQGSVDSNSGRDTVSHELDIDHDKRAVCVSFIGLVLSPVLSVPPSSVVCSSGEADEAAAMIFLTE